MGLGNNNSQNKKFITIVGGKFTLRVDENTQGAVKRVMTKEGYEGKEVFELYFDHIDGYLRGGLLKEGKFGTDLCLFIEDGDTFCVQIPTNSNYFNAFARCVSNIDPTQWLYLGLGFDKEKLKHFMYIRQGKVDPVSVHSAHTKDNPNGCPQPEDKIVKGKKVKDWTVQENFLYDKVVDFLAMVSDNKPSAPDRDEVPHSVIDEQEHMVPEDDSDRVPF